MAKGIYRTETSPGEDEQADCLQWCGEEEPEEAAFGREGVRVLATDTVVTGEEGHE